MGSTLMSSAQQNESKKAPIGGVIRNATATTAAMLGSDESTHGFLSGLLGALPQWSHVVENGTGAFTTAALNISSSSSFSSNGESRNSYRRARNGNGSSSHEDIFFRNGFGPIGSLGNGEHSTDAFGAVGNVLTPSSSPHTNSSSCNSPPVSMCGRCDIVASVRCLDCNDVFCEDCTQHHNRTPFSRDHCIVPLQNISPIGTIPTSVNGSPKQHDMQCESHHEILRYVCENCKKVVCQECTLWEHKDHICKPLKSFVSGIGERFRNGVGSGKAGIQFIKGSIDRAVSYSQSVEREAIETGSKIRKSFRNLILAAEDRERALLERVDKIRQQKITNLSDQMAGLRAALAGISQTTDMLNKSADKISQMSCLEIALQITRGETQLEQFAHMCRNLCPKEEFIGFVTPSFDLIQDIRSQGEVMLLPQKLSQAANGPASLVSTPTTTAPVVLPANNGSVAVMSGRRPIRGNMPPQTSIQRLGSWESHGSVSVVSLLQSSAVTGSSSPSVGQCIPGSGLHVITRPTLGPTRVFGIDGQEDGQVSRPWGLCVDKDGHIIIADRRNNRIQIFYSDGSFKHKFGSKGTSNGQFDLPAGICVDPQNRIVVVDKDNHRVQIFSISGAFLHKFGCYGKDCGQFQYPWDITCNSKGELLVTDTRNHRIQLFNPDGHFISRFSFDGMNHNRNLKGLTTPRGVCFTPQGDIIVSDFENHRLLLIDSCLTKIIAVKGHEGNGSHEFSRPSGVICDDEGRVIVADSKNQRVLVYSLTLEYLWSVEIRAPPTTLSIAQAEEKDRPSDVAILPNGRLVVMVETSPDARETSNKNKPFVQIF